MTTFNLIIENVIMYIWNLFLNCLNNINFFGTSLLFIIANIIIVAIIIKLLFSNKEGK